MTSINIAKQISQIIKEQASNDEPLQEFILGILSWELNTKGAFPSANWQESIS